MAHGVQRTKLTISADITSPHSSWPGNTFKDPTVGNTTTWNSLSTQTSILAMSLWSLVRDRARMLKAVYKQIQYQPAAAATLTTVMWQYMHRRHYVSYNMLQILVERGHCQHKSILEISHSSTCNVTDPYQCFTSEMHHQQSTSLQTHAIETLHENCRLKHMSTS